MAEAEGTSIEHQLRQRRENTKRQTTTMTWRFNAFLNMSCKKNGDDDDGAGAGDGQQQMRINHPFDWSLRSLYIHPSPASHCLLHLAFEMPLPTTTRVEMMDE